MHSRIEVHTSPPFVAEIWRTAQGRYVVDAGGARCVTTTEARARAFAAEVSRWADTVSAWRVDERSGWFRGAG